MSLASCCGEGPARTGGRSVETATVSGFHFSGTYPIIKPTEAGPCGAGLNRKEWWYTLGDGLYSKRFKSNRTNLKGHQVTLVAFTFFWNK